MTRVLFLGNSHLSALKLAYDEMKGDIAADCEFFCARAADLAFTQVEGGIIKPVETAELDAEEVALFFPDGGGMLEYYSTRKQPSSDVGRQFSVTGGASEIDLSGLGAIFYVAGVSPYDFRRLREKVAPISATLRRELLTRTLDKKFLLRPQILAVREMLPHCRHYLIGTPLTAALTTASDQEGVEIIQENRFNVQALARNFMFDDVFKPPEELLDETLLATRDSFCKDGRQESEEYQNVSTTKSDRYHMNREYGKAVFRKFIEPCLMEV